MVITKVRQLGKLTLLVLIRKKSPEFVGDIKIMIDNDPQKSMMAIAKNTGVSEFLIRKTVHDCLRYFSYKMRRGQQDSAPCHTSRKSLAWLSDNYNDHITRDMWPHYYQDCNPP